MLVDLIFQCVLSLISPRVANFSSYCASKWAVEGATEAMSHEVKPEWGIKFTLVEPGGFRYTMVVFAIQPCLLTSFTELIGLAAR